MQQEAEPRPKETTWEIPIRDRTMRITVNEEALHEATKGLRHGPCSISFDQEAFYQELFEHEALSFKQILGFLIFDLERRYGIKMKRNLIPLPAGLMTRNGKTEIFINTFSIIKLFDRDGISLEDLFISIKAFILSTLVHEVGHADQDEVPSYSRRYKFLDKLPHFDFMSKDISLRQRIVLGLIDIAGTSVNLAYFTFLLSNPDQINLTIVIPLISSLLTINQRKKLHSRFAHEDSPLESSVELASHCPCEFDESIIKFELIKP